MSAIVTIYLDPSAFVSVNGMRSSEFNMSNNTQQECPLLPIIFALVMEPLAQCIRDSQEISGLSIGETIYADDVIVILSCTVTSLQANQKVLQILGDISYYKVNETKARVLGFNMPSALQKSLRKQYPYECLSSIKYLGIQLSQKSSYIFKDNYSMWLLWMSFLENCSPIMNL